jgi:hypothetical protein
MPAADRIDVGVGICSTVSTTPPAVSIAGRNAPSGAFAFSASRFANNRLCRRLQPLLWVGQGHAVQVARLRRDTGPSDGVFARD